jgi:hypothetical protein
MVRLAGYKLQRKYRRWAGTATTDDSNDRSRIAAILSCGAASQAAPGETEKPALSLRMPASVAGSHKHDA